MGISDALDDLVFGLFIAVCLLWVLYDALTYSIQQFMDVVHGFNIAPYVALLVVAYIGFRCYEIALRNHKRLQQVHDAATVFFDEIKSF